MQCIVSLNDSDYLPLPYSVHCDVCRLTFVVFLVPGYEMNPCFPSFSYSESKTQKHEVIETYRDDKEERRRDRKRQDREDRDEERRRVEAMEDRRDRKDREERDRRDRIEDERERRNREDRQRMIKMDDERDAARMGISMALIQRLVKELLGGERLFSSATL